MDRRVFVAWMKKKVEMQRRLAALLLDHAAQCDLVLAEIGATEQP